MDFLDKFELDKGWLECSDYLCELGFSKDIAIFFTKMYAYDNNFAGYMRTVSTIVETAIKKNDLTEALNDMNTMKRTFLQKYGRSDETVYDEIELNVGDEFFLVKEKAKCQKGKTYEVAKKEEVNDSDGRRIEYTFYNDHDKPAHIYKGDYILKF